MASNVLLPGEKAQNPAACPLAFVNFLPACPKCGLLSTRSLGWGKSRRGLGGGRHMETSIGYSAAPSPAPLGC